MGYKVGFGTSRANLLLNFVFVEGSCDPRLEVMHGIFDY